MDILSERLTWITTSLMSRVNSRSVLMSSSRGLVLIEEKDLAAAEARIGAVAPEVEGISEAVGGG
jgi:hypothetical protein